MIQKSIFKYALTNLFIVLSADKTSPLKERKSFLLGIKDFLISQDEAKELFQQWKENQDKLIQLQTKEENRLIAASLISVLLHEESLSDTILHALRNLLNKFEAHISSVENIFRERRSYLSITGLNERVDQIALAAFPNNRSFSVKGSGSNEFYISNHVSYEGFDELQRLILAYKLSLHVAIDGPPGVGKTQSVLEVAKILDIPVFTKTCSSRTTESHIISYPALIQLNGVSVTSQIDGPLLQAMKTPGIFYGDEFNLLKEDVQKRMNSAFDERAYIDRTDGAQVLSKSGFWGVISYNPTENMIGRDLEDSVADRFVHFHYERWTSDFKAYIASVRSKKTKDPGSVISKTFEIHLEWRGIDKELNFFRGEEVGGKIIWKNFFTGVEEKNEPAYIYRVNDTSSILKTDQGNLKKSLEDLASNAFSDLNLARILSRFTDLMHSLASSGTSPLLKKIGLSELAEKEDLELLSIHESSARIEIAALRTFQELLSRGCNRYLAQSYATRLVIDQVCYGQYRNKKLRDKTVHSLVVLIARSMKLFADNAKYNTKMISDSLLNGN